MDDFMKLKEMFSGVDPKKLEAAMKKAQVLSQNPNIKAAFSKADSAKIASLISNMNASEKSRLMAELSNPKNSELLKMIKNNM